MLTRSEGPYAILSGSQADPFFPGAMPNVLREGRPFSPVLRYVPLERLTPVWQRVEKPGRYTGGEFGIPEKNPEEARARIVFSYPDTYELGMSNEGIKILYDRVQRRPDLYADRTALPWPDFGQLLQQEGIPLYSLDRRLEVRGFDVWGFNVAHELHHTNLLYAMDLAGIPLLRVERGPEDPLILVGGTAVTNPLPLFGFADAIFLGDGEEGILEILDVVAAAKEAGLSRLALLERLASVAGLVLPDLWAPIDEGRDGMVRPRYVSRSGQKVQKRVVRAQEFSNLEHVIVPSLAITQDRAVIEVNRGCGQGCRFCHAGFWKRPVRNVPVDRLVEQAAVALKKTGADSLTLHSLSIADYPYLDELVVAMARRFGPDGVSLSLPSLRVQVKTIPVLEMTAGIRKSSVTFALEAGSELMRERIHKKTSEENLQYLMGLIFDRGWDLVKVYFMLGLPDPEGREVDDLIRAANELGDLARRHGQRKNVNITVSLFVPKPFTTFQWEAQRDPTYFEEAVRRLRAELRTKRVHVKHPSPWMAWIEGILSRADHRIGPSILAAYRLGARFDSWDDRFRPDIWQQVLAEHSADTIEDWTAQHPHLDPMPWQDVVDGFPAERLVHDHEKYRAITEENMKPAGLQELRTEDYSAGLMEPVSIPAARFEMVGLLRMRFAKAGSMVYISHLDTIEVIRKALRRAALPVTFSRGFNKHERLHLGSSLPIYFRSRNEVVIAELYDRIDPSAMHRLIARNLPEGLSLLETEMLERLPDMRAVPTRYSIQFSAVDDARRVHSALLSLPEEVEFEKRDKKSKGRHTKLVSKRLRSALHDVVLLDGQPQLEVRSGLASAEAGQRFPSVTFTIDPPEDGAVSVTDLLTRVLDLPSTRWNVDVVIEKLG